MIVSQFYFLICEISIDKTYINKISLASLKIVASKRVLRPERLRTPVLQPAAVQEPLML